MPAPPGALYRVSLWARGKGTFQVVVYQYSVTGLFLGSTFLKTAKLGERWKPYRAKYRAVDRRVANVRFAVHLLGKEAVGYFDDCSFALHKKDNPGLVPKQSPPLEKKVRLVVVVREARCRVLVNGKSVSLQNIPQRGNDGYLPRSLEHWEASGYPCWNRWRFANLLSLAYHHPNARDRLAQSRIR